ncbi:hypothetical protein C8R43DRAFT_942678 [Mycena crocata]|nr:hypothetical protein C8R43DRAFT_942678 [Mycena crocata]
MPQRGLATSDLPESEADDYSNVYSHSDWDLQRATPIQRYYATRYIYNFCDKSGFFNPHSSTNLHPAPTMSANSGSGRAVEFHCGRGPRLAAPPVASPFARWECVGRREAGENVEVEDFLVHILEVMASWPPACVHPVHASRSSIELMYAGEEIGVLRGPGCMGFAYLGGASCSRVLRGRVELERADERMRRDVGDLDFVRRVVRSRRIALGLDGGPCLYWCRCAKGSWRGADWERNERAGGFRFYLTSRSRRPGVCARVVLRRMLGVSPVLPRLMSQRVERVSRPYASHASQRCIAWARSLCMAEVDRSRLARLGLLPEPNVASAESGDSDSGPRPSCGRWSAIIRAANPSPSLLRTDAKTLPLTRKSFTASTRTVREPVRSLTSGKERRHATRSSKNEVFASKSCQGRIGCDWYIHQDGLRKYILLQVFLSSSPVTSSLSGTNIVLQLRARASPDPPSALSRPCTSTPIADSGLPHHVRSFLSFPTLPLNSSCRSIPPAHCTPQQLRPASRTAQYAAHPDTPAHLPCVVHARLTLSLRLNAEASGGIHAVESRWKSVPIRVALRSIGSSGRILPVHASLDGLRSMECCTPQIDSNGGRRHGLGVSAYYTHSRSPPTPIFSGGLNGSTSTVSNRVAHLTCLREIKLKPRAREVNEFKGREEKKRTPQFKATLQDKPRPDAEQSGIRGDADRVAQAVTIAPISSNDSPV